MGCACNQARSGQGTEYVVTFRDGTVKTYDSPMTARVEAGKHGGKLQARSKPKK